MLVLFSVGGCERCCGHFASSSGSLGLGSHKCCNEIEISWCRCSLTFMICQVMRGPNVLDRQVVVFSQDFVDGKVGLDVFGTVRAQESFWPRHQNVSVVGHFVLSGALFAVCKSDRARWILCVFSARCRVNGERFCK